MLGAATATREQPFAVTAFRWQIRRLGRPECLLARAVSEVPTPADGDMLVFEGETYIVQGEPVRDAERLIWTLDTRPA